MRIIDKLFAVVAIPVGGLLILLGIVGAFTGFSYRIDLPPVFGALPIILGWSLCFTISRLWRISVKYDKLRLSIEHDSDEFRRFIKLHPEYVEADSILQERMFRKWMQQDEAPEATRNNPSEQAAPRNR